MAKYYFTIKEISKEKALEMVQKYHYSNTLPKLNKHFLGFYLGNELVGLVTLGWGTRPLHTIKKIFPSLETKDYYEIGRMCMTESMPRNSESQMISSLCKWLKQNEPHIKVLFTWADGMLGKCGYVYQACSFHYIGYFMTDIYMKDGQKIHPRQTRALLSPNDKRKTVRPTQQQMQEFNIQHYKGKQFKYFKFLCGKTEKKYLLKELLTPILDYPKENSLGWKKQVNGKWIKCEIPQYKTDLTHKQIKETLNNSGVIQPTIFDFIEE
jgi:hypothetical protein